jgi:phage-related protein
MRSVSRPPAVAEVFDKKTRQTPKEVIEACRRRLRAYDHVAKGGPEK